MRAALGTTGGRGRLVASIGLVSAPLIAGLAVGGYGRAVAAVGLLCLGLVLMAYRGGFTLAVLAVGTSFVNAIAIAGPLNVPDLFLIPGAVVAITTLLRRRQGLPVWFVAPVVGLAAAGSVLTLLGLVPLGSLFSLYRFVGLLAITVLVVGVLGATRRRMDGLALAFLIGVVVHSGLATLDATGIWHLASNLTGLRGFASSGRVTGLTLHSNLLGLSSAMAVPFALYFAARRRAYYVCVPVLVMGIVASGSRAAVLAAVVGAVLYVVVTGHRVTRRLVGIAVLLVGAALAAAQLGITVGLARLARGNTTAARADAIRDALSDDARAEFLAHPFFGVGFGPQEAHDLYLELARSGGVLAVALFVYFAGGLLLTGRRLERIGPTGAATASFASWLAIAIEHNALTDRFLYVPAGLIVAAWLVHRRESRAIIGCPAELPPPTRRLHRGDDGEPDRRTHRPAGERPGARRAEPHHREDRPHPETAPAGGEHPQADERAHDEHGRQRIDRGQRKQRLRVAPGVPEQEGARAVRKEQGAEAP